MSADGLTPASVVDACEAANAATGSPGSSFIEIGRESHGNTFTTYINPGHGALICREMLDYMKASMESQLEHLRETERDRQDSRRQHDEEQLKKHIEKMDTALLAFMKNAQLMSDAFVGAGRPGQGRDALELIRKRACDA